MTKIEHAIHLIETLQIAEFFTFLKNNAKPNEMLTRLEHTFILGKADVDFYPQCKTLANVLLSENVNSSQTTTNESAKNSTNISGNSNIVIQGVSGNNGGINISVSKKD